MHLARTVGCDSFFRSGEPNKSCRLQTTDHLDLTNQIHIGKNHLHVCLMESAFEFTFRKVELRCSAGRFHCHFQDQGHVQVSCTVVRAN